VTLAHWDDVEGRDVPDRFAPLGGRWQRLADAAGSVRVGAHRVLLAPGQMITPPHVHSAEEEIFHVLGGSATLWQDGSTCTVGSSDTLVFAPGRQPRSHRPGQIPGPCRRDPGSAGMVAISTPQENAAGSTPWISAGSRTW